MPRFTFAKSTIWDGAGLRIDGSQPTVTVKVQKDGEEGYRRALAKAGDPGLGRHWILVGSAALRETQNDPEEDH